MLNTRKKVCFLFRLISTRDVELRECTLQAFPDECDKGDSERCIWLPTLLLSCTVAGSVLLIFIPAPYPPLVCDVKRFAHVSVVLPP